METIAPAKINLFLEVLRRRDDGYHELRTLMCCIGLCDTLKVTLGGTVNRIRCDHPDVPSDESNLALRAAELFNHTLAGQTGIAPKHVTIELAKRIPAGAGLGGGSSDAAAVLNLLNGAYKNPFNVTQLQHMALALGADVPFFILRQPALAGGIGEQLEFFGGLSPWGVVVIYPGFGISTAQVFENLNLGLTKCKKKLRYFLFDQGKFDPSRHLCNDLEAVAIRRFPVLGEIKNDLLNQGAVGSLMTGSGSAVFGLFADVPAAQKAADGLSGQRGWQIIATELRC
jgi:4-diphosphocytidyl-2-C-methyl-D-erythritol kinase